MGIAGKKSKMKIAAVAAGVCILAVVALTLLIDADQFRPRIEAGLSAKLGREVRLGKLRLSLFSGRLSVDGISIMDNPEFGGSPFVAARSLYIGVRLTPLIFSRKVHITDISLEQPSVYLRRSPGGEWNISSLGAGSGEKATADVKKPEPVLEISVERLRIADGHVEIIEAGKNPAVYEKVAISVDNFSSATASPFTLTAATGGGGLLVLNGIFGPLNQDDTLLTPFDAALKITDFDPAASGFIPAEAGFSGLFNFSGDLNSDGRAARSKGTASVVNLRLVNNGARVGKPVSFDYDLRYDLEKKTVTFADATVGFGQAAIRLYGDFDTNRNASGLRLTLKGSGVPVDEIQEFLPALGVTLPKGATLAGGMLDTEITAEGFSGNLTMDGRAEIKETTLTGFDLGDKITLIAGAVGLKPNPDTRIEKLYAAMRWTAEGIAVKNIQLVVPSLGELSGVGTISPRQELNFTMRVIVSNSALTQLTKGKAVDIGFFVRGAAANPEFVPDYKDAARILIDAVLSGKDSGQANPQNQLMDSLKGLFRKR